MQRLTLETKSIYKTENWNLEFIKISFDSNILFGVYMPPNISLSVWNSVYQGTRKGSLMI